MADYNRRVISGQHGYNPNASSIPAHSRLKKAALAYADRGKPVFPCKPDKSPHTRHGFKDATTDRSRVHAYWNQHRMASIAMPTGQVSGYWILDVDRPEALDELEQRHSKLPATWTVRTPRGGLHVYFRHVEGITNRTGTLPEGIDVRGEGGYVLVPPSEGYSLEDRFPVAEAPGWLLDLVREKKPTAQGGGRRPTAQLPEGSPIPEGARNTTLFFMALDLKDDGTHKEQATADLLAINESRCAPPLDAGEVRRIVESAYRYPVIRRERPPEVLAIVDDLKRAWWTTAWRGVGGKTERDVLRVLIEWVERYGYRVSTGIRFTLSWRTLALAAACSFRTVSRVVPRLKAKGWLVDDNATRSGTEAGAFILLPRPTDITRINAPSHIEAVTASDVTLARLPEETPCFRWRGFVGKGKAGVLYALEVFGEQSREELADRLGFSRPRDLERKYLVPLVALGLVEDLGGVYALRDGYRERVEQVRRIPYGGGERRVRRKDDSGRVVTSVREVPATSEVEREEMDRRAYEEQRVRYAKRLAYDSPEADEACRELLNDLDRELDRVAEADGLISELEHVDLLLRLSRGESDWEHADAYMESLGFGVWLKDTNPEYGLESPTKAKQHAHVKHEKDGSDPPEGRTRREV